MKSTGLDCRSAKNLVRRVHSIRVIISVMENFTLISMSGCSIYNIITKLLIEEIFEWIFSLTNVKPSFVLGDVVKVFISESNEKKVFTKMSMDIYVRDLQNDMIKPSYNCGL